MIDPETPAASGKERNVLIQVSVNARKCMANQMCVRSAPDIFELGAAGYSRVKREVTEADLAKLREAEEMCPTSSITVEVLEEEGV
jgi:ferredoxin